MNTQFRSTLVGAALALCVTQAVAQRAPHVFGATPQSIEAPTFGGCLTTNPSCYHDWAHEERDGNRVLLYTRTAGPRHANIQPAATANGMNPPPLCEQPVVSTLGCVPTAPPGTTSNRNAAQRGIIRLLNAQGIVVDWTEDVGQLNNLHRYKAVIFLSTSRDTLWKHGTQAAVNPTCIGPTNNPPTRGDCPGNLTINAHLDAAKTALRQYMRAGGGFVAIHNAFGTEYNWPWYEGLLGNANYYDHGANQNGTVQIESNDPIMAGIGPKGFRWPYRDEWYNLVPYPQNVKYLATVDENTLATRREIHPGHGNFHPVAWCHYYNGGRVFATTLGHDPTTFDNPSTSTFPGIAQFQSMITNGVLATMGLLPFCTP
jgi:hypothetical protein